MMEVSKDNGRPAGADELFVQLLTGEQFRLLHYITMLLGNADAANNVLQETNLVLWRKAGEFEHGTSFSAWSRRVAYWQVQAHIRDKRRERHVFSDALLTQLASNEADVDEELDARVALRHCMTKVRGENIELLRRRYADGVSIAKLAATIGRTESAIKTQLMRLRRKLLECIERQLNEQSS